MNCLYVADYGKVGHTTSILMLKVAETGKLWTNWLSYIANCYGVMFPISISGLSVNVVC